MRSCDTASAVAGSGSAGATTTGWVLASVLASARASGAAGPSVSATVGRPASTGVPGTGMRGSACVSPGAITPPLSAHLVRAVTSRTPLEGAQDGDHVLAAVPEVGGLGEQPGADVDQRRGDPRATRRARDQPGVLEDVVHGGLGAEVLRRQLGQLPAGHGAGHGP